MIFIILIRIIIIILMSMINAKSNFQQGFYMSSERANNTRWVTALVAHNTDKL
jgi:hypothetical protein